MSPSSGARSGTKPSRSGRGAGDGSVAREILLVCGHRIAPVEPVVSGPHGKLYRCDVPACGLQKPKLR